MKTYLSTNKMGRQLLALFLCLLAALSLFSFSDQSAFAWSSDAGQQCTSAFGGYLVGNDGQHYYTPKQYTVILYHPDGTTSYLTKDSGIRRRSFEMITASGEHHRVYCVESGVEFKKGNDYVSESGRDSNYFKKLPRTVQQGIMLASLHGYQPGKSLPIPGINEDDYWLATQLIIWEYQQQIRVSPTSRKNNGPVLADTFYSGIKGRPAELAYNWILTQMAKHSTVPSFTSGNQSSAPIHTLKYDPATKQYVLSLTDSNNTGIDLSVVSDGGSGISVKRQGNQYIFTSKKMISTPISLQYRKNILVTEKMLIWGCPGKQTMVSGADDPIVFYINLQTETYGKANILKTSEDGNVADIPFRVQGNGVDQIVTTGPNGQIEAELLPGTYTVSEQPLDQYVTPQSQTVTVESGQTKSVSFSNILKKFRVEVTKRDSETGNAQGDGSLGGAEYGLYKNEELVDTYTTDQNGEFITAYYPCDTDWTLKEQKPSEGYLLDETVYSIGADPKDYTIERNTIQNDVHEQVIKGQIQIVKHTDDGETGIETPEKGAKFQIYLASAGSFENAADHERDVLVITEDGLAKSKPLPYGRYIVSQLSGWEGTEHAKDFVVSIDEHDKTYTYIINNATITSKIRIEKRDSETGKLIPAASSAIGFQIKDPDGHLITQTIDYPTPVTLDTFYCNADGWLMLPYPLEYGAGYELIEVESPHGYFLDGKSVYFDVDGSEAIVTVVKKNTPQKGRIIVHKTGEVLSHIEQNGDVYQPVYTVQGLPGAVYDVIASKNIVTGDGTVRAQKGDVVDTITTSKTGTGSSDLLYLGQYEIVERIVPENMTLNPNPKKVVLSYAGQTIDVTEASTEVYNERQRVAVSLTKYMEQDEQFHIGMNEEILSVRFGLFAAEPIQAADGSFVPVDGLLEMVSLNKNGEALLTTDLPVGAHCYVKELATDEHYQISDTKYPVKFEYAGQEIALVKIAVNDGQPIENRLIRGSIQGIKQDENSHGLSGAVIGLFRPTEKEYTKQTALMTSVSAENGSFSFHNVPYGHWVVREIATPDETYILSDELHHVYVTGQDAVVELSITNAFVRGSVQVKKVDAEYPNTLLSGAVFEVYEDSNHDKVFDTNDLLIGELSETDPGIYERHDLRYNGYFIKEKTAPAHFILDENAYYFAITENNATVLVETHMGQGFVNRAQKGALKIVKRSADDVLEGFAFEIQGVMATGQDYAETFVTDYNGEIHVTLRPGKYTVSEVANQASNRYVLPEDQTVVIKADETSLLEFMNEIRDTPKTGDYSNPGLLVALVAISLAGALSSALVIHRQSKRNQNQDTQ